MSRDPLVDEVRRQRAEILKSYDWDFERMSRDVMQRQWQSGWRVVSRAQEPPGLKTSPRTPPEA